MPNGQSRSSTSLSEALTMCKQPRSSGILFGLDFNCNFLGQSYTHSSNTSQHRKGKFIGLFEPNLALLWQFCAHLNLSRSRHAIKPRCAGQRQSNRVAKEVGTCATRIIFFRCGIARSPGGAWRTLESFLLLAHFKLLLQ